jgi:hypothetical protein
MLYYVMKNNEQTGPYPEEQLDGLVATGQIAWTDSAWRDGADDWVPLGDLVRTPVPPPLPPSAALVQASTVARSYDRSRMSRATAEIGGWLLFFCIMTTIVMPLTTAAKVVRGWHQEKPVHARYPVLKQVHAVETGGAIVIAIMEVVAGTLIWSGHPKGRNIALIYLVARGIVRAVAETWGISLMSGLATNMASAGSVAGGIIIAKETLYCIFWCAYFLMSERVRDTYNT